MQYLSFCTGCDERKRKVRAVEKKREEEEEERDERINKWREGGASERRHDALGRNAPDGALHGGAVRLDEEQRTPRIGDGALVGRFQTINRARSEVSAAVSPTDVTCQLSFPHQRIHSIGDRRCAGRFVKVLHRNTRSAWQQVHREPEATLPAIHQIRNGRSAWQRLRADCGAGPQRHSVRKHGRVHVVAAVELLLEKISRRCAPVAVILAAGADRVLRAISRDLDELLVRLRLAGVDLTLLPLLALRCV